MDAKAQRRHDLYVRLTKNSSVQLTPEARTIVVEFVNRFCSFEDDVEQAHHTRDTGSTDNPGERFVSFLNAQIQIGLSAERNGFAPEGYTRKLFDEELSLDKILARNRLTEATRHSREYRAAFAVVLIRHYINIDKLDVPTHLKPTNGNGYSMPVVYEIAAELLGEQKSVSAKTVERDYGRYRKRQGLLEFDRGTMTFKREDDYLRWYLENHMPSGVGRPKFEW